MRCWNFSSGCACFLAISIYITTVTAFFKALFSLRIGSSVLPKTRFTVPTDHVKVDLGCVCRALALVNPEWGLRQVHRICAPVGNLWPFMFCVGGLTGEYESHIKLWSLGLLFCASGWSIVQSLSACHTKPVDHMAALAFSLLLSSLQGTFSGDTLSGYFE